MSASVTSLSSFTNGWPRKYFAHNVVEARQRPQRLLIHRLIPRRSRRTHQQERIEERIVDRPLQRMRLMQARELSRSYLTFHVPPVLSKRSRAPGFTSAPAPSICISPRASVFPQRQSVMFFVSISYTSTAVGALAHQYRRAHKSPQCHPPKSSNPGCSVWCKSTKRM